MYLALSARNHELDIIDQFAGRCGKCQIISAAVDVAIECLGRAISEIDRVAESRDAGLVFVIETETRAIYLNAIKEATIRVVAAAIKVIEATEVETKDLTRVDRLTGTGANADSTVVIKVGVDELSSVLAPAGNQCQLLPASRENKRPIFRPGAVGIKALNGADIDCLRPNPFDPIERFPHTSFVVGAATTREACDITQSVIEGRLILYAVSDEIIGAYRVRISAELDDMDTYILSAGCRQIFQEVLYLNLELLDVDAARGIQDEDEVGDLCLDRCHDLRRVDLHLNYGGCHRRDVVADVNHELASRERHGVAVAVLADDELREIKKRRRRTAAEQVLGIVECAIRTRCDIVQRRVVDLVLQFERIRGPLRVQLEGEDLSAVSRAGQSLAIAAHRNQDRLALRGQPGRFIGCCLQRDRFGGVSAISAEVEERHQGSDDNRLACKTISADSSAVCNRSD